MKITKTPFEGLIVIEPDVFADERGYFFESFNTKEFEKLGIKADFVQDNQSLSKKGVLRGMHFQKEPFAQGKLIRVVSGAVFDIVVDLRKSSKTYKKSFSIELSGKNKKMLLVPKGFAHGFLSLADNTIFQYKCTNFYNKESEVGLNWADKQIKIDWQLKKYNVKKPTISDKDKKLPYLEEVEKLL